MLNSNIRSKGISTIPRNLVRWLKKQLLPHWTDLWPEIVDRSETSLAIHLGCGVTKTLSNAVNVDVNPMTNPDVICDLNNIPYPFKNDTFDMVVAMSILEHLQNFFSVMGEIHRISRNDASVYILVPHFSSAAAFIDPTHRVHLSSRSCNYFISGTEIERDYGFYVPYRYRMSKCYIELEGIFNFVPPLKWFVNRYPTIWENYLCYVIRGAGIFWELKVVK